jgi:chaperonin cofactor prefoldin
VSDNVCHCNSKSLIQKNAFGRSYFSTQLSNKDFRLEKKSETIMSQIQAPQINIGRLSQLRQQIEKIAETRKTTKTQLDEIEAQAIDAMMKMNRRSIGESPDGPFWVLGKAKTDGSWNADRYREFFTLLLTELRAGKQFTPEQLVQQAQKYLKQFEKRRLQINKLAQARQQQNGVQDLRDWLAGKDDPSESK